jgi:hypothetical protein
MKRITRFSLALIMFSLFSISYIVTSVSAQNGTKCGKVNTGWCTNAEIAASQGTAGGATADVAPAPLDDGLMGGPAMSTPEQMGQDCAGFPHPDGSVHVDPPESQIEAIEAEYKASCKAGNCALSEATYNSLASQGHSRGEVDCFMAEGERNHQDQHGGMQGNHGGMTGGPGGMQGNHGGMTGGPGGMQGNHGGMTGGPGGMQGNHGGMTGNHGGMQGNHGGMQGNHGGMQGNYEGNGEASGEGRGIPKTDDGGWQERKDAAIAKCVKEASTSGSYNEEKDNKWCEDNYNNYL